MEHCVVVVDLTILKRVLYAPRVVPGKDKRPLALRVRIVFVLKTFVIVPMVLKPLGQHALQIMLIFVRIVPVNTTRPLTHAQDALRVVLGQEKRLRALPNIIVLVLKTFVCVQMVLKQRAHHVPTTMLIFVCLVQVGFTKTVTYVLHVQRVALEQEKRLLALRNQTVFVLKTFVLVPMVLQQPEQNVPHTMRLFVHRVTVGTQKTQRVWI